jgi:hypothetical protein
MMNHRVRAACTGQRGLLDHDPAVERALQLLGDELVAGHCALIQDPGSTGQYESPAGGGPGGRVTVPDSVRGERLSVGP